MKGGSFWSLRIIFPLSNGQVWKRGGAITQGAKFLSLLVTPPRALFFFLLLSHLPSKATATTHSDSLTQPPGIQCFLLLFLLFPIEPFPSDSYVTIKLDCKAPGKGRPFPFMHPPQCPCIETSQMCVCGGGDWGMANRTHPRPLW